MLEKQNLLSIIAAILRAMAALFLCLTWELVMALMARLSLLRQTQPRRHSLALAHRPTCQVNLPPHFHLIALSWPHPAKTHLPPVSTAMFSWTACLSQGHRSPSRVKLRC